LKIVAKELPAARMNPKTSEDGVPPPMGWIEELRLDRAALRGLRPWQAYGFAMVVTAATLGLRLAMDGTLGGRPTLVIFTLPIMLSAYVGGLRAGLLATLLSYLAASYYLLPPLHSFQVASGVERWQQFFVALAGVFISVLNESHHRTRRKADRAISEHRQADERVRWLASFPEQNPNPIAEFERESGDLTYANPAATSMIPELRRDGLRHPALAGVQAMVRGWNGARGETVSREMVLDTSCYNLVVTQLADSRRVRIYGSDVTERKRTEEARQASEARYHALFEYAPDGIVIADPESYYLDANASALRMLGYTRAEFIGLHARDIVVPTEAEHIEPALGTIKARAEYHREWQFRRKDGSIFDAEVTATMMPDGNLLGVLHDITERKRATEALRESEVRLQAVTENLTEGLLISALDGQLLHWNRAGLEMHGFHSLDEALCKVTDFAGTFALTTLEGASVAFEDWPLNRILRGECLRDFEVLVHRLDIVWERTLSFSGDIVRDLAGRSLAFLVMNDITMRQRIESALGASELRYRRLFETAKEGILILDAETGMVVDVNPFLIALLGFSHEQFLGKAIWELGVFKDIVASEENFAELKAKEYLRYENLPLETIDGHQIEVEFVSNVYLVNGGKVIQCSVRDLTARRKAEEAVRQLHAELEERVLRRTSELEAANKELEAFSYSVSHDLRTPLRAVDGFSQAVLEDYGALLPEEGREYLQTIREGAQKMGILIDDLLTFSRLSRAPLRKHSVNTGNLIHRVLEELSAQQAGRQIDLRLGELPASPGDPALLKQIWINLLSNALKYTRLRETTVIEIGCSQEKGEDIFFVRDNGAGFDMAYADKLFGVFHRLHRAEEYEGTGVGLAIVQRIVHRHGGRIWAEAAVDRGATFYFTLQGKTEL
jgi:PAS domain S-box-containing protein